MNRPTATRVILATWDGRCNANPTHLFSEGEHVGLVDGVGWCCCLCFETPEGPAWP